MYVTKQNKMKVYKIILSELYLFFVYGKLIWLLMFKETIINVLRIEIHTHY